MTTREPLESRQRCDDINERPVPDITLEFFYKPHTVTLLACVIVYGLYHAFTRDDSDSESNFWFALKAIFIVFMVISMLTFPNGPFTRPHPLVWRMVFGASVFYLLFLHFVLHQNLHDIRRLLKSFDPALNETFLVEKDYAVNCSDITFARLWDSLDVFCVAHILGWVMKAMLIRHAIICWYISITWEITELAFYHLLPNFEECWWDMIGLDILLCNGLGIWIGLWICKKLEMRTFHWESIKNINTTTGKLKRAVLQFTPESWVKVNWLDPHSSTMRIIAVWFLVIFWQVTELNTFFLKHIFAVETPHPLNIYRIWLIGLITAPTVRQFYSKITDPKCDRLGTQCWVFCAITLTEAIVCIKFGKELFALTQMRNIFMWLVVLLLGSIGIVYACKYAAENTAMTTSQKQQNGEFIHEYLDSSYENLNSISNEEAIDVRKRKVYSHKAARTVSENSIAEDEELPYDGNGSS